MSKKRRNTPSLRNLQIFKLLVEHDRVTLAMIEEACGKQPGAYRYKSTLNRARP